MRKYNIRLSLKISTTFSMLKMNEETFGAVIFKVNEAPRTRSIGQKFGSKKLINLKFLCIFQVRRHVYHDADNLDTAFDAL